ncbi:MAG: DUF3667 domain-containing protein [Dysgonomonas sp.]
MSKHKIRSNKVCQNCGTFVERYYCPKCGQENSESRQSFYHVFTHFAFDFIHYDSSFWRTTKYLFLSPGKLSLEYMKGKRKSYVNPFTLYIFISFIAFFLPAILPEAPTLKKIEKQDKISYDNSKIPSINIGQSDEVKEESTDDKSKPKRKRIINPDSKLHKTFQIISENMKDQKKGEEAFDFFIHNIPKVLFFYMPLFAFWLWLFHNKKKKYYFDSAVFTLHFFSTVLLTITIMNIISCIFDWLHFTEDSYALLYLFAILYITFYFFRGNRVFFEESRLTSNLKSFLLIGINNLFILITFILYVSVVVYIVYT